MLQAVLAFFAALPEIMKLIKLFEKKLGPDWSGKLVDIGEAYAKLANAKTQDERDIAGRAISSLFK